MTKQRNWTPCRVCGASHNNLASSSICSPCGKAERAERSAELAAAREEYETSPFGQFMGLPEEDRWRAVFEFIEGKVS